MKSSILVLMVFSSLQVWAQNPGYLGKKNILEVNSIFNYVLFANNESIALDDNNNFVKQKDHFDFGFQLSYYHTFSKKISFGIRTDRKYYSTSIYTGNPIWFTGDDLTGHQLKMVNWHFIPTITFNKGIGISPVGISHELGIGIKYDRIVQRDEYRSYHLAIVDSIPSEYFNDNGFKLYNYDIDARRTFTLNYTIKLRYPIKDWLLLNFALNYRFCLADPELLSIPSDQGYYLDTGHLFKSLNRRESRALIQASLGLSIPF